MVALSFCVVFAAVALLVPASCGLKCRSEDEKNNDEFVQVANMCLSNASNFDNPSIKNNRGYNAGRYNGNTYHSNRNPYDGNMDSHYDSTYNRNDGSYNRHTGDHGNTYGLWRKQQNSGGYGFSSEYSDSQQNPYYNPRSGLRSNGNQDKNNQRKNINGNNVNKKNNNTNSTLELQDSSPIEQLDACIIHCIFQGMHMLDDSALPDKSLVTKVMTKRIREPKLKDFIEDSIEDCFELLETDDNRNNCEYSKNLALCLEETGRRNCDDWELQSDPRSSNNRRNKNPKRPN